MLHSKPEVPQGHGEILAHPPYEEWAGLARTTPALARAWETPVAGRAIRELRAQARREAVEAASAFSTRLGVPVASPSPDPDLLVMTGHQPELYHPGVWVKNFLLQRLADQTGAAAIDLVVDTDRFESVEVAAPCLKPAVERCVRELAVGSPDSCYACAPVPNAERIEQVCGAGDEMLATLPAPAIRRHFSEFCECMRSASIDATNLSELVTFARRRFEATARTDYLELPVSTIAGFETYRLFVAHLLADAESFAFTHNGELAAFREMSGIRSEAQPFPDLRREGDWVESPFWLLGNGKRDPAFVRRVGDRLLLKVDGGHVELPGDAPAAALALADAGFACAPRATTLTMYARLFVADLFIHGVGGGNYDRVTDAIIQGYLGIQPPPYTVASLTMYLPLGGHLVTDDEISEMRQLLHRLEHNPDSLVGEVAYDSAQERSRAVELARRKRELVEAIGAQGADKKSLGIQIRDVNATLGTLLAPLRDEYEAELERLEGLQAVSEVLTDRTYPFCFWNPEEVRDKVT